MTKRWNMVVAGVLCALTMATVEVPRALAQAPMSPADAIGQEIDRLNEWVARQRRQEVKRLTGGKPLPSGFSPDPFRRRNVVLAESERQLDAMLETLKLFNWEYGRKSQFSGDSMQVTVANGAYGRMLLDLFRFEQERKQYGEPEALRRMSIRAGVTLRQMDDYIQDLRSKRARG